MSDRPDLEPAPPGEQRDWSAAIRDTAFGALVAGGICLYFGFAWAVDAPFPASPQAEQVWYLVDHIFQWWLRILGVSFLLATGLSAFGNRLGVLGTAVSEASFALLMLAMIIDGYLEARAAGGFDAALILFAVLLVVALSASRHSWRIFIASGQARAEKTP